MNIRFTKTRRNRKSKLQSGGNRLTYPTLRIFDLSSRLTDKNIFGTSIVQYNIDKPENKLTNRDFLKNLVHPNNLVQNGNLFNNSVAFYNYKGSEYLVGVARVNNRGKDDTRTRTTIQNRDPFSNNSNWYSGWGEPDLPVFFIIDYNTEETQFFYMNTEINYLETKNKFTLLMEDPRIMLHSDARIVLFYGHHNTKIGPSPSIYDQMGTNLEKDFNGGPKRSVSETKYPQYLYTSWCSFDLIDQLIEDRFVLRTNKIDIMTNSVWKLLCSNLLNNTPEKNWVVIRGQDVTATDPEKRFWFDFIRSIGEFTKSVVVYRSYLHNLTSPPITNTGAVNQIATKCDYIETLNGLVKLAGDSSQIQSNFKVDNNDKITIISHKAKFWFNVLVKVFVLYLKQNQDHTFPSAKFKIRVEKDRIRFWYPFLDITDGKTYTEHTIERDKINNYKVSFLKGISSGGPTCGIIEGSNWQELLAVGHFKCIHQEIYIAMVAALVYKSSAAFQTFVNTQIQKGSSVVDMSDSEKKAFLQFVSYLTDEVNIFRYTYSVIHTQTPMNARAQHPILNTIQGSYKNTNVLHHNQMYCTYLFKVSRTNYQLLSLSPQFYFDYSPKDCTAPVLQFASTIASNGIDTYFIPYGHHDVLGRIAAIGKDDLHSFLRKEVVIKENKSSEDHEYYLGVIKQFFRVYMFKPNFDLPLDGADI